MLNSQPKRKPYRNKKILAAARGEVCLVNLPGCTGGGEDTVAAHSNQMGDGKGGGQKADDFCSAFSCASCHDVLDNRKAVYRTDGYVDTLIFGQELIFWHDRGIKRTIRRLLDIGVLK